MAGEKRKSDRLLSINNKSIKVPKSNEKPKLRKDGGKYVKSSDRTAGSTRDAPKVSDEDFFTNNCDNVVNVISQLQRGFCKTSSLQQIVEKHSLSKLKWCSIISSFLGDTSPRITALQWHPHLPNALVLGGKHGDLIFGQKFTNSDPTTRQVMEVKADFPPTGPGGTMEAVRFKTKPSGIEVCTASVDGTLSTYNFEQRIKKTLVETYDNMSNWFCSVDVHEDGKTVCGGDNKGTVAVHRLDSGSTDRHKLHSSKVKHLEFSPRDPNLMVTSSLEKTVRLWDLRKIKDKKSCIEDLKHVVGVSAAKFSLTDGCRLLTCDMGHELRVYKAPLWTLEHKIDHPHRSFRHMTNITPSWHPRADIFVIGCYPDPKLPQFDGKSRSVDIFSARQGQLVNELMDSNSLITSLAMFNSNGNCLATTSGKTLHFWQYSKVDEIICSRICRIKCK